MVVVETPDAVMVAHKDRTQDVKKVVARLKAEGRTLTQSHRKVYRPWGWYDSIDAGERFQVKRIVVNPGASAEPADAPPPRRALDRGQGHGARSPTASAALLLAENESTYIPLGHTHRLSNPGKVPLEIIEVQSGSYLARTTSSASRTPTAAELPERVRRISPCKNVTRVGAAEAANPAVRNRSTSASARRGTRRRVYNPRRSACSGVCGDGGIGRRTGFRFQRRKA
jgi:mannose-6-phosphate isomerase-like protein (cupin superfamily)